MSKFKTLDEYLDFFRQKAAHARQFRWQGHTKQTPEQKKEAMKQLMRRWRANKKNNVK